MMQINFKKYLVLFVAFTLLILISVISFNWLINPYGIFDSPSIEGININKTEAKKQYRMSLAYYISREKPAGIILGSSRALALPKEHTGWSAKPVANLALAGSSMYEVNRYFEHALSSGNLKQVVLALDFFQFNQELKPGVSFLDTRLHPEFESQSYGVHLQDIKSALISIKATHASYLTILKQPRLDSLPQQTSAKNKQKKPKLTAPPGGHRQAFIDMEKLFLTKLWFPFPCRKFTLKNKSNPFSPLKAFHDLLEQAYVNDIDLRILISPSHARLWQALELAGLWPDFENWKKELVVINENLADELDTKTFPIWDFSGYNDFTHELVPEIDQPTQAMHWYLEASHYRNTLATLIFDMIFNSSNSQQHGSFGIKLTKQSIDNHLSDIRNNAIYYAENHPEDIAELEDLASRTASWRISSCD